MNFVYKCRAFDYLWIAKNSFKPVLSLAHWRVVARGEPREPKKIENNYNNASL